MKASRFVSYWGKVHKIGEVLYIVIYAVLIPIAGSIGKVIGEYIGSGILFRSFRIPDYIALLFLCFVGILIGTYSWKHNEDRYRDMKSLLKN